MVNVNDKCLVFYIFWLRTVTKSTRKILKLDWETSEFFSSSKRVGTLYTTYNHHYTTNCLDLFTHLNSTIVMTKKIAVSGAIKVFSKVMILVILL